MKTFPDASTATPLMYESCALVAGLPSPPLPYAPVPAMVVTMPVPVLHDTIRMLWFIWSATYTLPDASAAKPYTELNNALVAAPPSPVLPYMPACPAIVEMVEELRVTTRTRLLSPMYTLSLASTANALGYDRDAIVAGPPSLELP